MIRHINDGSASAYPTANFPNVITTLYIAGLLGTTASTPFVVMPAVGESEVDFWTRVGVEFAAALSTNFGVTIDPIIFTATPNALNTDITTQQYISSNVGVSAIRMEFTDGITGLDLSWNLERIDMSLVSATSYNSQIARSQDDLPRL